MAPSLPMVISLTVLPWTQTYMGTDGSVFTPFIDSLMASDTISEHLFSTWLTINTTGSQLVVGGVDNTSFVASSQVVRKERTEEGPGIAGTL